MPVTPVDLNNSRILVTGPTSQVAIPWLQSIADKADITAIARFSNSDDETMLRDMGIATMKVDLADRDSVAQIGDDYDYIVNFAVVKTDNFEYDLKANAEGVGYLMARVPSAKGFLHFSSTAVYDYQGHSPRDEQAPLGDNHRAMYATYSISKIAAESVCRFAATQFGIPTTIARLSVPYGDNGGWMYYHLLMMRDGIPIDIHPETPNYYNPLHSDDYNEKIPYLLGAASTEVTTVNFGGSQRVAIEEWCEYLTELTGLKPIFNESATAFGSLCIDVTKMHELIGETKVDWREGVLRQVKALAPELLIS